MSRAPPEKYVILQDARFHELCGFLGLKGQCCSDPDKKVIERAFRKKALKTHPDKGGNPVEFKKINDAYNRLIGHITKLELVNEETDISSNSIIIEISKIAVPKWRDKLKKCYGVPKCDNVKNLMFEGPYEQFRGRSNHTGPITVVLYFDPQDCVPKLHIQADKYMAWITEQRLPLHLHVDKGRQIQFDQWRICHLAEFGLCSFMSNVNVSRPPPPTPTPKPKRKAREKNTEPKPKSRRDSTPKENDATAQNKQETNDTKSSSEPKKSDSFGSNVLPDQGKPDVINGERKKSDNTPKPKEAKSFENKPFTCGQCGTGYSDCGEYSKHRQMCIPDEEFHDEMRDYFNQQKSTKEENKKDTSKDMDIDSLNNNSAKTVDKNGTKSLSPIREEVSKPLPTPSEPPSFICKNCNCSFSGEVTFKRHSDICKPTKTTKSKLKQKSCVETDTKLSDASSKSTAEPAQNSCEHEKGESGDANDNKLGMDCNDMYVLLNNMNESMHNENKADKKVNMEPSSKRKDSQQSKISETPKYSDIHINIPNNVQSKNKINEPNDISAPKRENITLTEHARKPNGCETPSANPVHSHSKPTRMSETDSLTPKAAQNDSVATNGECKKSNLQEDNSPSAKLEQKMTNGSSVEETKYETQEVSEDSKTNKKTTSSKIAAKISKVTKPWRQSNPEISKFTVEKNKVLTSSKLKGSENIKLAKDKNLATVTKERQLDELEIISQTCNKVTASAESTEEKVKIVPKDKVEKMQIDISQANDKITKPIRAGQSNQTIEEVKHSEEKMEVDEPQTPKVMPSSQAKKTSKKDPADVSNNFPKPEEKLKTLPLKDDKTIESGAKTTNPSLHSKPSGIQIASHTTLRQETEDSPGLQLNAVSSIPQTSKDKINIISISGTTDLPSKNKLNITSTTIITDPPSKDKLNITSTTITADPPNKDKLNITSTTDTSDLPSKGNLNSTNTTATTDLPRKDKLNITSTSVTTDLPSKDKLNIISTTGITDLLSKDKLNIISTTGTTDLPSKDKLINTSNASTISNTGLPNNISTSQTSKDKTINTNKNKTSNTGLQINNLSSHSSKGKNITSAKRTSTSGTNSTGLQINGLSPPTDKDKMNATCNTPSTSDQSNTALHVNGSISKTINGKVTATSNAPTTDPQNKGLFSPASKDKISTSLNAPTTEPKTNIGLQINSLTSSKARTTTTTKMTSAMGTQLRTPYSSNQNSKDKQTDSAQKIKSEAKLPENTITKKNTTSDSKKEKETTTKKETFNKVENNIAEETLKDKTWATKVFSSASSVAVVGKYSSVSKSAKQLDKKALDVSNDILSSKSEETIEKPTSDKPVSNIKSINQTPMNSPKTAKHLDKKAIDVSNIIFKNKDSDKTTTTTVNTAPVVTNCKLQSTETDGKEKPMTSNKLSTLTSSTNSKPQPIETESKLKIAEAKQCYIINVPVKASDLPAHKENNEGINHLQPSDNLAKHVSAKGDANDVTRLIDPGLNKNKGTQVKTLHTVESKKGEEMLPSNIMWNRQSAAVATEQYTKGISTEEKNKINSPSCNPVKSTNTELDDGQKSLREVVTTNSAPKRPINAGLSRFEVETTRPSSSSVLPRTSQYASQWASTTSPDYTSGKSMADINALNMATNYMKQHHDVPTRMETTTRENPTSPTMSYITPIVSNSAPKPYIPTSFGTSHSKLHEAPIATTASYTSSTNSYSSEPFTPALSRRTIVLAGHSNADDREQPLRSKIVADNMTNNLSKFGANPLSGSKSNVHFSEPAITASHRYPSSSAIHQNHSSHIHFSNPPISNSSLLASSSTKPTPSAYQSTPAKYKGTITHSANITSSAASSFYQPDSRAKSEGSGLTSNISSLSRGTSDLFREIQLTKDKHRENYEQAMRYNPAPLRTPMLSQKFPRPEPSKYPSSTFDRREKREKQVIDKLLLDRQHRAKSDGTTKASMLTGRK